MNVIIFTQKIIVKKILQSHFCSYDLSVFVCLFISLFLTVLSLSYIMITYCQWTKVTFYCVNIGFNGTVTHDPTLTVGLTAFMSIYRG